MNNTPSKNEPGKKVSPSHRVYFIKGEGENAQWLELGAAWDNADGKGFNIVLDVLPVGGFNGRLTARKIEPKTGA